VNIEAGANLTIILITSLVSLAAMGNPRMIAALIFWPPAVNRGQYHRFVTHGFIHADGGHLLFNMITLYFFGSVMERLFEPYIGMLGYVLFYLGGIVVAMLPSWLRHRHDPAYRSLGASGAVSAVLFAFILIQPWALIFVFFIPVPAIVFAALYVAYSIWAERRARDNINHSAHLWGAAYGVLFTLILEPRVAVQFLERLFNPFG
jgi:membrane associated rhomboid family serine protease